MAEESRRCPAGNLERIAPANRLRGGAAQSPKPSLCAARSGATDSGPEKAGVKAPPLPGPLLPPASGREGDGRRFPGRCAWTTTRQTQARFPIPSPREERAGRGVGGGGSQKGVRLKGPSSPRPYLRREVSEPSMV